MSTSRKTMHAAGTSLRFAVLTVGAIVMTLPFAYTASTTFRPQVYVLETLLKFIPDLDTVDNFVQAWTTQDFSHHAPNSASVSMTSTVLAVWFSSMMAYALARFDFPYKEWFFRVLFSGLMVPSTMLITPQFVLMKQPHLTDNLRAFVLFYTSGNLAFNTFLLRSFFEGIPRELDGAMEVDDANAWTRYWRLVMPLARPVLATTVIFTFLATWDGFAWAFTVILMETKRTLPIAIQLFHGQNSIQWGLVFAVPLITILPVVVVYLIFQRHSVAGLIAGAVKG